MINFSIVKLRSALKGLIGLKIFNATNAADMRGFGFQSPERVGEHTQIDDWYLHIMCSWRILDERQVVTGSFDWYAPISRDVADDWNPAKGGSVQEALLRDLFADHDSQQRVIHNQTEKFLVQNAKVDVYGGFVLYLSGGYRLETFPAGSSGEFWCLLRKGDLNSYVVCEGRLNSDQEMESVEHPGS